ncbi:MAG TPA: tRNA pseudouridine(55) synthase TruB, partial [Candidatus Eisenbacteria bacterium]|nr:tRNA pseudouridine(55) synthase TruB [Candidatus Eisenbacteria bacterium]
VVDRVVGRLGFSRVGHAGTLDPFAQGLLLVLWDRATPLVPYLQDYPKTYVASIRFGRVTDSQDRTGRVLEETDASHLDPALIEKAMRRSEGWIEQVPPTLSAVKWEGQPAHRRTRRGERLDLAPRRRYVHRFELLEWTPPLARTHIVCASGTYVRTLAHDLGDALGTGASLDSLERKGIGPFRLEDAIGMHALDAMSRAELLARALEPADALPDWPSIVLEEIEVDALVRGLVGPLCDRRLDDRCFRALDQEGHLIALVQGGRSPHIVRGFRGEP